MDDDYEYDVDYDPPPPFPPPLLRQTAVHVDYLGNMNNVLHFIAYSAKEITNPFNRNTYIIISGKHYILPD